MGDTSLPTTTPSEDAGSLAELLEAVARTPDTLHHLPQPDLLGSGFSIRRELGAGAFGVVYEAHDHQREQTVALKVLNQLDATSLYNFKREFRALTNLRHQQLVQLYELYKYKGHWFFSMELVEGCSLSKFLVEKRRAVGGDPTGLEEAPTESPKREYFNGEALKPCEAAAHGGELTTPRIALSPAYIAKVRSVITQLCHGVQVLHGERMLHRDLKPSNFTINIYYGNDAEGPLVYSVDFTLPNADVDAQWGDTGYGSDTVYLTYNPGGWTTVVIQFIWNALPPIMGDSRVDMIFSHTPRIITWSATPGPAGASEGDFIDIQADVEFFGDGLAETVEAQYWDNETGGGSLVGEPGLLSLTDAVNGIWNGSVEVVSGADILRLTATDSEGSIYQEMAYSVP